MKESLEEKVSNAKSLTDVLLIVKQIIMQDTHVATLAYLETLISPFDGKKGIWACKPFPLDEKQSEYQIQAYHFSPDGDNFKSGSIVLVVFTDMNFINGLQTPGPTPTETRDEILHSIKYGVMVSLPGVELTEEEKEEILEGI